MFIIAFAKLRVHHLLVCKFCFTCLQTLATCKILKKDCRFSFANDALLSVSTFMVQQKVEAVSL